MLCSMKKKSALLSSFTLFIFSKSITAQVTQLELTMGFYKSDFSSFTIKSLDDKNKFSISTLAFFQKFYRKEDFLFDETGVQTSVYWNFTKNLSVGPSLYYNSVSGFSEKLSFLIFIGGSHLVFVAIPAIFHTENDGSINGGLFFQLQYMKRIKRGWNFWVNTQILTSGIDFQRIRGVSSRLELVLLIKITNLAWLQISMRMVIH